MAARAGTLSAAERSYPTSDVRGGGLECQAGMAQEAERSYPASKVRGCGLECQAATAQEGREELPRIRGLWQPGGATLRPRSGAMARRGHPTSEVRVRGREETPHV